jgi:AAA15 family ATPase/GTPase
MKNNEKGIRFELIAKRNETSIPLKFESEGIKKIISILHMLIVAFNNPGVTFVIDELDSGIYEYLLGELLAIFEMHGKGQLIFTSHNLRPLEMLDKQHLYFTTTNPKNRYIQLTNIDTNHNVRLSYFRSILLGGQKEQLYEETTRTDIARAFRNAGEVNGEE